MRRRELLRLMVVTASAAAAWGCHVQVGAPPPVVEVHGGDWYFYPDYDVYMSPTYGWCYWDGVAWVVVQDRPAWLSIRVGAPRVRVGYRGRAPYTHWDVHVHSPRHVPRSWGRRWRP
ncbi:MAG: hypothetical protein AB7N76_24575 [Planctomycetota bacterium]